MKKYYVQLTNEEMSLFYGGSWYSQGLKYAGKLLRFASSGLLGAADFILETFVGDTSPRQPYYPKRK